MIHRPTGGKIIRMLRGLCVYGSQVFMGNSHCILWKVFSRTVGQLRKPRPGKDRVANANYSPPVNEAVSAQAVEVQAFSTLWELTILHSFYLPLLFSPVTILLGRSLVSFVCLCQQKAEVKGISTAVTRPLPGRPWLSYQLIQGILGNKKPGILFPIPNKRKKELNNQGLSTKRPKHSSPASFSEILQTSTPFVCAGALNC